MWKECEAARYRRVELLEEAERRRLTQRVRQAPQPSLRARVARRRRGRGVRLRDPRDVAGCMGEDDGRRSHLRSALCSEEDRMVEEVYGTTGVAYRLVRSRSEKVSR